jgi:cobalamin biosynthesis protein CobT
MRHKKLAHALEEEDQMEQDDSTAETAEDTESGDDNSEGSDNDSTEDEKEETDSETDDEETYALSVWHQLIDMAKQKCPGEENAYNLIKSGYKNFIGLWLNLQQDEVHRKIRKTQKDFREGDDMDEYEAWDAAISKRKYLLKELSMRYIKFMNEAGNESQ